MTDMAETWLGNFAIDSSDGTFGRLGIAEKWRGPASAEGGLAGRPAVGR